MQIKIITRNHLIPTGIEKKIKDKKLKSEEMGQG